MSDWIDSPQKVMDGLIKHGYLADRRLATILFLSVKMQKPLLVEGPAGVGKTDLARALAGLTGSDLVRLQCYPGLDEGKALYEWNYQMQLLYLQASGGAPEWDQVKTGVYTHEFLLARPVLKAFLSPGPVVLLVDEVDKGDDEMESFLLEALSDYQVSIPELGTVKARNIPAVIITSNSTRELSDALKRRCLHLYIPFPGREREEAIILMHLKDISRSLAAQVSVFLSGVRKMAIRKLPGISESVDWARALMALDIRGLDHAAVRQTLGVLLKYEEDVQAVESRLSDLIPENTRRGDGKPDPGPGSPPGAGSEEGDVFSRFNF